MGRFKEKVFGVVLIALLAVMIYPVKAYAAEPGEIGYTFYTDADLNSSQKNDAIFKFVVTSVNPKEVSVSAGKAFGSINDITIPGKVTDGNITYSVTSIPDYGFVGASINTLIISEGMKSIGGYNFNSVKKAVLPSSVTYMGQAVFESVWNLYIAADNPPVCDGLIASNSLGRVDVPPKSVDKYKAEWATDKVKTTGMKYISVDCEGKGTVKVYVDGEEKELDEGYKTRASFGSNITLKAIPTEGYVFDQWEVVEGDISINDNKFKMPLESDVSIKAKFKIFKIEPTDESNNSCDHNFEWQIITSPTATTFGTEGYVCTKCGATKDVREMSPISQWALWQIANAKPGDVLIMDFGPWNSYPLWMMQMIADKPTVTYIFKYTYQGNKYEVTIKPGDKFALDCDWYGPLKMPTLFDTVITKW